MITPENIASHEIIGLRTEIVESSNPQIIGLKGIVIDETKSMFVIKTDEGGKKNIPKQHNRWKFFLQDESEVTIPSSMLNKRPYDRLGKKI